MNENIEWKNTSLKNGKKMFDTLIGTLGRATFYGRDWFNCECGTEGLILEDEIDRVVDSRDGQEKFYHAIHLSLWEQGKNRNNSLDFKSRLAYCWHVLKTGSPWADAILLHSEEAEKLANEILNRINFVRKQDAKTNE